MDSEDLSINLGFDSVQYKAEDQQTLRFSLINDSNETMYVLKWDTPFEGFNNDMFRVIKDGTQAVYMGRIVKRGPPQPDDYITIPPKDSASVNVDLSEAYDINEPGSYSVEFKSPIMDAGTVKPDERAREMAISTELTPIRVSSNVASFELLESRSPRQLNGIAMDMVERVQAAVGRLAPSFNNCPTDRENELNDALAEALRIALVAKTTLTDTLEDQRPEAIRCSTWFGIYDRQRYDKVTGNFDKIWDALENKGITFNCDCDENFYAYVYPTRPYEIFLCKLFWRASLTGTDSRSGTIVHETSHFNVVAGTDDHIYGQTGCQNLAISDPSDAIANADSHEYFAENTPPLTMGTNTSIYAIKFNDVRSSVDVFGRDSSANFKVSLYAVTTDGRLAQIWDTDRWNLDFPVELSGHSSRFTGSPVVFGRDPAGNKKALYAVMTDGRLAQIWDTDRWNLDFPVELSGHPDLRFTGSPAVFGRDSSANFKVSLYAVTTDGRLAQIWDTDRWNLDFPVELSGHSSRFTGSPAVFGRDPAGNKKALYAVMTDGRLAQIWDTDRWNLDFPVELSGHPDLRFTGSPAVFGRDSSANFKVSLYAVTTDGRLAQIWDTDRWNLDFPAELSGHPDLRFTGSPAVFGRDSSANFKVSLYAVTTDGRLAQIWDTDRWNLDFPAELSGHPDLRFTGSPVVFGRDPAGNKKALYAVTTDGRLAQIWDTDRWNLDFQRNSQAIQTYTSEAEPFRTSH